MTYTDKMSQVIDHMQTQPCPFDRAKLEALLKEYRKDGHNKGVRVLENLIPQPDPSPTCWVQSTWRSDATTTGRWISMKPNLLQLRPNVQDCIIGDMVDIYLIEPFVFAWLAQDQELLEAYSRKQFFEFMAKDLKTTRKDAKTIFYNFYLRQSNLALTQRFPKLAEMIERVSEDASQKGFVETAFLKRKISNRYSPKIPSYKSTLSTLIQGTAVDIMRIVLTKVLDEEIIIYAAWPDRIAVPHGDGPCIQNIIDSLDFPLLTWDD